MGDVPGWGGQGVLVGGWVDVCVCKVGVGVMRVMAGEGGASHTPQTLNHLP